MLRSRTLLLAPTIFVLAAVSCGGTPPPVTPKPVTTVAKVTPPPPTRAKWVFSRPERGFVAKLELGDEGTLYVGRNGRRTIVKAGAEPTDATTLSYENLVGVVRDDKGQFSFVADDGDVYSSPTALGPLDTVKEGPLGDAPNAGRLSSITTGKTAIMGIAPDGRVLRTADGGATWKPVDYAGASKPYGKVGTLALDGKGNGLLLHFPQKLFVTHDDGATWAPVASPGIGAKRVYRDGKGKVFLDGVQSKRAKLDGNAVTITTESPEPILKGALPGAAPLDERADVLTILSGERVVEFVLRTEESKEIEVSSAKIGDKLGAPTKVPELYSDRGLAVLVAGYGSELVYLRADGEEEGDSTTIFRSKDYGVSWVKDGTIDGTSSRSADGAELTVGPKGWTFVTSLCQSHDGDDDDRDYEGDDDGDDDEGGRGYGYRGDDSEDNSCSHRQIKPAGAKAFEDLAFVEEFSPQSFAFDEAHDRVYAIGKHQDRLHVYESPLSMNKFTRSKVLDVDSDVDVAMSVDEKGTLRVFERDDSHAQWIVHRRGGDTKDMPTVYVPAPSGTMSFAGPRGLLFGGHEKGYETADGGETWMRVATNGFAQGITCSVAGCLNGGAARVGWDIPVIQNPEKITAQTTPQPTPAPHITPPAPNTTIALPRLALTCKSSGAVAHIAQTPYTDMVDTRSGDVRWGFVKHDADGKTSLVVGTKTGTRELALQGPTPKDPPAPAKPPPPGTKPPAPAPERRSGQVTLQDGMVLARYAFQARTGSGLNPVDVELTWYSAITGKVVKKTLPQMKPFRVSRYGFSGTAQIVDGGLLFRGSDDDAMNFIHDDGKVEPLTIPSSMGIRYATHLGKRWVLEDTEMGNAIVNVSDDGKTWSTKAWGLDASYAPTLSLFGDKAMLSLTRGLTPLALFGIEATLPDDPPSVVVVDQTNADPICDAKSSRTRFLTTSYAADKRTLKVDMGTAKDWSPLSGYTRIMHATNAGKLCTSAFTATSSGNDQTAYLYPEPNNVFSGWRFRRAPDPKDKTKMVTEAEPISCSVPK